MLRFADYSAGHPWYYYLGGPVLSPKQIRAEVNEDSYLGYISTIDEADQRAEPERSHELRKIRNQVLCELKRDLSRYREVVFKLHAHRREHENEEIGLSCDHVHTNVSLKHNHLYNGFGHLLRLDDLLARQPDLFG